MEYRKTGNSGLKLPAMSLGLWHNFGHTDDFGEAAKMICYAFEQGITHFDLANNYGPPPGAAEENFGKILKAYLPGRRDEMVISSKAGHLMWDGPYGDGSSRKSIMASINQSLKRTGLDYFDIFYTHRYDAETPVEETMQALVDIVRQGKALYIGISKYPPQEALLALQYLRERDVPALVFQDRYSMLNRKPEEEILPLLKEWDTGFVAFSPLAQGVLTNKYLNGIPTDSRAANPHGFLKEEQVTDSIVNIVSLLNELAIERGQTMAQMALSWVLAQQQVTSVIVGARNSKQLEDSLGAVKYPPFTSEELQRIDNILNGATL